MVTVDHKGKEKSEKIIKLTPELLILQNSKKPDQPLYFVSLKKTLKDFEKTNAVKVSAKKLAGTWKAVAVHTQEVTMLLGMKYVFNKDKSIVLKTPLNNTLEKGKGTWKLTGDNKIQLSSKKKEKIKTTNITVLYFTNDMMVAKDDKKGEKILFERVR